MRVLDIILWTLFVILLIIVIYLQYITSEEFMILVTKLSCGYCGSSSSDSENDDKTETQNNISGRYTDTDLTEPLLLRNNNNESGRESLFDVDLNSLEDGGGDATSNNDDVMVDEDDEDIQEILSVSSKLSDNVVITVPDKEESTSTAEIDNTTSASLEIKDDEDIEKVQSVADDDDVLPTTEIDNNAATSLEIKGDEDVEKVQTAVADNDVVQQKENPDIDRDDKINKEELVDNNLKDEENNIDLNEDDGSDEL